MSTQSTPPSIPQEPNNSGSFEQEQLEQLREEIQKLKDEKEKYLLDFKKARADLLNYKQEEQSRLQELMRFANERIIKELIGILDSFDLALQSLENMSSMTKDNYLKGVYLIKNQLVDLLEKEGLEEIKVILGNAPDLREQEIVAEIETDLYPEGTIGAIFQKGYKLHGKLLRPVRIAIAKKPLVK